MGPPEAISASGGDMGPAVISAGGGDMGPPEVISAGAGDMGPPPPTPRQEAAAFLRAANAACHEAGADDLVACLDDVITTGHLQVADFWTHHEDRLAAGRTGHLELLAVAYRKCATVSDLNYELCIEDVLDSGNVDIVDKFAQEDEPSLEMGELFFSIMAKLTASGGEAEPSNQNLRGSSSSHLVAGAI